MHRAMYIAGPNKVGRRTRPVAYDLGPGVVPPCSGIQGPSPGGKLGTKPPEADDIFNLTYKFV